MGQSAGELLWVLRRHSELDLVTLSPTERGESGSAFTAADRDGTVSIVKVLRVTGPEAENQVRELDTTVRRLRERGYPAARLLASGYAAGMLYWIQELLPGSPLDGRQRSLSLETIDRLLPELLRLNDAQTGLGTGSHQLAGLVRTTLSTGGDGYCVHATLRDDPRTRDLLAILQKTGDRYGADLPDRDDYVHYDFNTANILSDGNAVTGVIDLNPPVLTGDRAFDLATLLFYVYDHDRLRDRLRARLLDLVGPGAAAVYLAHMVLRQVDWSLRHYPDAPETDLHLRLASLVVNDLPGPLVTVRPAR